MDLGREPNGLLMRPDSQLYIVPFAVQAPPDELQHPAHELLAHLSPSATGSPSLPRPAAPSPSYTHTHRRERRHLTGHHGRDTTAAECLSISEFVRGPHGEVSIPRPPSLAVFNDAYKDIENNQIPEGYSGAARRRGTAISYSSPRPWRPCLDGQQPGGRGAARVPKGERIEPAKAPPPRPSRCLARRHLADAEVVTREEAPSPSTGAESDLGRPLQSGHAQEGFEDLQRALTMD